MSDKIDAIARICSAIERGDAKLAASIGKREYPFDPRPRQRRNYTPLQSMRVFNRDGFVDRYTGAKLIFPGTLRLLAILLPEQFPWHPHGKLTESHIIHWELWPTIDHLEPVSRGGADDESNWVTTSMLKNQAKLHWTLEDLGWNLHPPGDLNEWDGLAGWCRSLVAARGDLLTDPILLRWHRAAFRGGRDE